MKIFFVYCSIKKISHLLCVRIVKLLFHEIFLHSYTVVPTKNRYHLVYNESSLFQNQPQSPGCFYCGSEDIRLSTNFAHAFISRITYSSGCLGDWNRNQFYLFSLQSAICYFRCNTSLTVYIAVLGNRLLVR